MHIENCFSSVNNPPSANVTTESLNEIPVSNSSTSSGRQNYLYKLIYYLWCCLYVSKKQASHSGNMMSPTTPRQQPPFALHLSDEYDDEDSDFSVGVNDDDYYN